MELLHHILFAAYIGLVLYGAWTDARRLRIANWISILILSLFVPVGLLQGLDMYTILMHFGAGVVILAIGFALFAFNLFGGGDAKLLAAIALWIGWSINLIYFVAAVVLVGGILAVLVVLLRRGLGLWPDWLVTRFAGLFEPNKAIPYGIAIAAGAMIMVPRMDVLPEGWNTVFHLIIG